MDEWTVVTAIVVLAGLIVTVARPLVSLNSTITQLTDAVRVLEKNLDSIAGKNSEQHARLWNHEQEQDKLLGEHEFRLRKMEERGACK